MAEEEPAGDKERFSVARRRSPGRGDAASPWSREAASRTGASWLRAEPGEPAAVAATPPAARPLQVLDATPRERATRTLPASATLELSPRLLRRAATIAAVVYALVLFDVSFGGLFARLDGWVTPAFAALPGWVYWTAALLSILADTIVLVAAGLGVIIYLAWRGLREDAAIVAISMLSLAVVVTLAKLAVGRMRPLAPETVAAFPAGLLPGTMSFPSGHATLAVLAWGLILVALLARPAAGTTWRVDRRLVWAWIGIGATVGVARLVFSVHWPSDVIAGWALGLAWLAATLAVWQYRLDQQASLLEDGGLAPLPDDAPPHSAAGPRKF